MRTHRKVFLGFGLAVLAFTAVGSVVHPFGDLRQQNENALLEGAVLDPETLHILQRSCANYHSERVEWPWYSHVAPASWMIESDVNVARSRFNLSRWPAYSAQEREIILSAIGAAAKTNIMPPRRYTLIHQDAALSESDRARLYEWSRAARHRNHK